MSRIEELRQPVQPIAKRFARLGFSVTDIISIGLLMIKDWDLNKLGKYREMLCESGLDADAIVAAIEDDTVAGRVVAKQQRKKLGSHEVVKPG